MLSHCANPNCGKPFLRLREGKLFIVEGNRSTEGSTRPKQRRRDVEHFWLCTECANTWTLVYDREAGIGLVPLRRPAEKLAPVAFAARSGVA